jgi:hypothetical protein
VDLNFPDENNLTSCAVTKIFGGETRQDYFSNDLSSVFILARSRGGDVRI